MCRQYDYNGTRINQLAIQPFKFMSYKLWNPTLDDGEHSEKKQISHV